MTSMTNNSNWVDTFNKIARPYLTMLITTVYNVALLLAVYFDMLPIRDYILAVGPTNAMIVGFWFGERAALKRPDSIGQEGS